MAFEDYAVMLAPSMKIVIHLLSIVSASNGRGLLAGSTLALRGAPTPTLLPPKEPMCHDCAERLEGWRIEVDSDEVILRDVHSELRLVFRRVGDQWVFDSAAL